MPGTWERVTPLVLLVIVAAALWATLDLVAMLVFCSLMLLLLTIHHWRHLDTLDKWLQSEELSPSGLPDSSGKWGDVSTRLGRLMREQRRSEEQLRSELERLRRAVSAMPEGVVILDDLDRIEWCNPVAEKHLGINAQRDTGQHIAHLVRQTQFNEYLDSRHYSEPLVIRQPRSQDLTLSLQFVPYGNKQKLLVSRDVTRLERVHAMRRDFVANVSHELRTPLTVIGGFLETLAQDDASDPETSKWALGLMTDQTQRMQHLVEDLLTLSRLEDSENQVREQTVDIPKMLRELCREAESLSAGRHRIRLDLGTRTKLLGNTSDLHSAFSNLISNAIRYTADGGRITLSWKILDTHGVFSVQDSGIGIEPEHIPRLTERFYRVDRGRSRETGGTGLGLAIVKHVLTGHQARLEITSELGKGSCFSAWFPAVRLIPNPASQS